MKQYIDKSALVAEIENLENTYKKCPTRNSYEEGLKDGRLIGYKDALYKIDTLEVKEISDKYDGFLGKELKMVHDEIARLEKLKVKEVDEQKERMSECPYRRVGCTMYKDKILECNGACSWVVDYLKLKELKAQKGE